MLLSLAFTPQQELAAALPVNLERARAPQYGRYLDEFVPGQVFVHPGASASSGQR